MTELQTKQNLIQRVLSHPNWLFAMAVLAMVTCLPTLWSGLFNDDFLQRVELIGPDESHQTLAQVGLEVNEPGDLGPCLSKLFIAVGPNKNRGALLDYGALPWWTGPQYKVSLLRPLATLTHWIDAHWLGDSFLWMHAHNIIWLGLIMGIAGVMYRTLMPTGLVAAGLGLLFLAIDSNHYFPTLWVANRNQLLALFFALLSLLCHHQWRTKASHHALVLSICALLASLLSAEGGVATFAYLFAYALCLDPGPRLKRLLSLLPGFVLIILWRLIYSHYGYGAQGGGFYFDPAGEPVAFVQAILQRSAFLLAGQWYTIPPDLFAFIHDTARWPYTLTLWALLVVAFFMCLPLLRQDRTARFWCVAMCIAIVPVCAAVPMGRNLLFASIAGFGLIAQFVHGVLTRAAWLPKARAWKWLVTLTAWVLIAVHGLVSLGLTTFMPKITQHMIVKMNATCDLNDIDQQNSQSLVIVNAPNPASMIYVPYKRALARQPLPATIHMLAPGYVALQVSRPDSHSLRIKALEANLLACPATSKLEIVHLYRYLSDFRRPQDRLTPGKPIQLRDLTITVESMDPQGHPIDILCRFNRPLEDATKNWVKWSWPLKQYAPFTLPAIGDTMTLEGPH